MMSWENRKLLKDLEIRRKLEDYLKIDLLVFHFSTNFIFWPLLEMKCTGGWSL